MFSATARFYDAVYAFKDYGGESAEIVDIVRRKNPDSRTLLDVACGTGLHLVQLKEHFEVEGVDLESGLLAAARDRLPGVPLHEGDMRTFDLGRRFDVVTCLFSSIGYVRNLAGLNFAVGRLAAHLAPGGILILDPWLRPDVFTDGHLGSHFIDEPDLKLARIHTSEKRDRLSIMRLEYLIGTPAGVERHTEEHVLGLFTTEEQIECLERHGLQVEYDPVGPMNRGRFIATFPA